jgi:hypothetical protein
MVSRVAYPLTRAGNRKPMTARTDAACRRCQASWLAECASARFHAGRGIAAGRLGDACAARSIAARRRRGTQCGRLTQYPIAYRPTDRPDDKSQEGAVHVG